MLPGQRERLGQRRGDRSVGIAARDDDARLIREVRLVLLQNSRMAALWLAERPSRRSPSCWTD
jgi:hypothetical protein